MKIDFGLKFIPTDELIGELKSRYHAYIFAYSFPEEGTDEEHALITWGNFYASLGLVEETRHKMLNDNTTAG